MKKILIFLSAIIISISALGQDLTKTNARMMLDEINLKADTVNPRFTGTATFNNIHVDGSAEFGNTGLTIDSIGLVGGRVVFYDGIDTLGLHIIASDVTDLSSVAVLLDDTTSGAGQYTSDHRADLIEADLADYEIGVVASDSANGSGAAGKWVTGKDYNTDMALKANLATANTDLLAYAAMGSVIKALPVGLSLVTGTNSTQTLSDGRTHYVAVYLSTPQTITGIKLYQATAGDYTADNYNGVGLYSVSGGTLTLRASSSDDGNIWKATANTIITKAFATPYAAPAGLYYIAILYNQSAQTTAPIIRGAASNTNVLAFDFANTLFISGTISSQNALATPTIESSTIAAYSVVPFGALY